MTERRGLETPALAREASDPLKPQKGQRGDAHAHPDREADSLVGNGKVDGFVGEGRIKQQPDNGKEGCDKECAEAGRKAHQQALEPAEVAQRQAKQGAVAAGSFDVMWRCHLQ